VGDIRKSIRSLLGAFLFSGDDIDKKVKVLSGGEKARLAMCKLLLQPYNFLVLDEPTNHLDLASKEVLKQALLKYDGTMLVVSHDRDFLDGLTKIVYEIMPDRLKVWEGNVLDFLKEKRAASIAQFEKAVKKKADPVTIPNESSVSFSRDEEKEREKLRKKLRSSIEKSEKDIQRLEQEIKAMDSVLANLDYSDKVKSDAELSKYEALKKQLEDTMQQWEIQSEELDALAD
jgi:ATP-binding cassette subfamily F protein 3